MSKWIEQTSRKIGLTITEFNIAVFLLAALLAGFAVQYFFEKEHSAKYLEYDYTEEDSLFNAAIGNINVEDTLRESNNEKTVAIKNELLDFGSGKKQSVEKAKLKTVYGKLNINTAGLEDLIALPGIGVKTAENILAYRNKTGKFLNAEQLLNIKGIGKAKLAKLREHIKFD